MKAKIDLYKFVSSLMERYYEKIHIDPTTTRCWLDRVLEDQALEYKDGEIVEIEQESEDEKIRKELIDYINRLTVTPNNIDRYSTWIAWLEKQGDKTVISHKFNKGDWIISKWGGIYQIKEVMSGSYNLLCGGNTEEINSITQVDNNSRLLCISDIKKLEEQVPKSKWTEEDEVNLNMAIYFMRSENTPYSTTDVEPVVEWLCGLKQRMEE